MFDHRLVNPSKETLEEGLRRELLEELGITVPVLVEDYVESYYAPPLSAASPSRLILHFYVKKIEEEQILEIERAAASTAKDHGQEVLGMVRVPLYTFKNGKGLLCFLSHSFVGNARTQLVDCMLRLGLIAPEQLHKALTLSFEMHNRTADDLRTALALTQRKQR